MRVKGKAVRIEEYFEKHKEMRYFRDDVGKYIATTKFDMCPKSVYSHKKKGWNFLALW